MYLALTEGLSRFLDGVDAKTEAAFGELIKKMATEYKAALEEEPIEAMLGLYRLLDETIAEHVTKHSCKRGCSHCCHLNVDIWPPEAKVIEWYCKEHNIPIDQEYLGRQMGYEPLEIPITPVSACVFLKNGECSIYEARPIMCRKYFVATPPDECDHKKYTPLNYKVTMVANVYVELLVSAIINALEPKLVAERMPKMILKQLNHPS